MQTQLNLIWQQTLDLIKDDLNTPTFKTWFENTSALSIYENTLLVATPNAFAKEWLESRYNTVLKQALEQVVGEETNIKFVIKGDAKTSPVSEEQEPIIINTRVKEVPENQVLSNSLNIKYNFDTFVIGACNRFAHAAALAVAEKPAKAYNPFFVYGGVGLGKTHLLHAISYYVMENFPSLQVRYVSSEKFTNDFIASIREKNKIMGFHAKYRDNDVLLVDDIQFLENKEATQEEFFHTFNTLYEAGKQIVISSDRPPKDIATLEERLRTRFEWGLITDIQPPDLETRIAILYKKAQFDSIQLPADVMEFIASRIQSNVRELEGALIRVAAFASITGNDISLDLAEEVLKDIFPEPEGRPISISLIQQVVSTYFNISMSELLGDKRTQSIVYPRQVAMYLARELTDLSLPKIGKDFGNKDHTTVMHSNSKIERLLNEKREVYNHIQELTNRIKQKAFSS